MSVPSGLEDGKMSLDNAGDHLQTGRGRINDLQSVTALDAKDKVSEVILFHGNGLRSVLVNNLGRSSPWPGSGMSSTHQDTKQCSFITYI